MSEFSKFIRNNSCMIISILSLFVIILSLQNAGFIPENYTNINTNNSEPTIVLFKADWCGHCKKLIPTWNTFKNDYDNKDNISIITIDNDDNQELVKKHNVNGFPTIKFCPNGVSSTENTITYDGDRNLPGLIEFFEQCQGKVENLSEELEEHNEEGEEADVSGYNTESFYNY